MLLIPISLLPLPFLILYAFSNTYVVKISSKRLKLFDCHGNAVMNAICDTELSQKSALKFPSLWKSIDGDWSLRYSNNDPSASRSFKNSIFTRDDVIQRIDSMHMKVYHILKFNGIFPLEVVLHHDLSVVSDSNPPLLFIELTEISVNGALYPLKLPVLNLVNQQLLNGGYFEVSCCRAKLCIFEFISVFSYL